MTVFVDTSVFSLAWRRDAPADLPQIERFAEALQAGEVISTGVVLQELLQGFAGPKSAEAITERFAAIPLLTPTRDDHLQAAALRNLCRQAGIQIGTIDALLAQLGRLRGSPRRGAQGCKARGRLAWLVWCESPCWRRAAVAQ